MQLINGKSIAEQVLAEAETTVRSEKLSPGLAVILVGTDPASEMYVGLKEKAALRVGVRFERQTLPATSTTEAVRSLIQTLNARADIHGIIVQLPLPVALDTDSIIATIDPRKDADGFHPETVARFLAGVIDIPPVFPRAIRALLQSVPVSLSGKRAIIFANAPIFSQVMKKTLCILGVEAESSVEIGEATALDQIATYDIVVTAKGKPNFLVGTLVRPGAIIIDGGITRVGDRVLSDAEQATFESVAGYITPVPGGVGPVTVAYLISRVVELARNEISPGGIL